MLLALLAIGLGMGFTSCSDDDDDNDNKSEQQKEEERQEQASTFWDVVGQLTSMSNYTEDYADKTFEPTIGEPDAQNALVRIVATNDVASAAERFADLVGHPQDFTPATEDYEWSDPAVGTLSYHKTDDGRSFAIVNVSIKQLPHLQQIIYKSTTQSDENDLFGPAFPGTAYYRFGDVIARAKGDNLEYWICVRPAFGPEGKKDSHWVSLSPLPNENTELYDQLDDPMIVPKGLGTNTEHMQNLAELLYAMLEPETWQQNVLEHEAPGLFTSGLRMFHDFSHSEERVQMHNQYFFRRVRRAWDKKGLFKTIFGAESSSDVIKNLVATANVGGQGERGLHLLVKGHSWWSKVSNKLTLYEYTYRVGSTTSKLNMHDEQHRDVQKDMSQAGQNYINLNTRYTMEHPYLQNEWFFGDKAPRYVIRHATGKELFPEGNNDPKRVFATFLQTYVYNSYFYENGLSGRNFRNLDDPNVEITEKNFPVSDADDMDLTPYEGNAYYHIGDIISDGDENNWFCILPAGGPYFKAPFSYFVGLDSVKYERRNPHATNIVSKDEALKVMTAMGHLYSRYFQHYYKPNASVFEVDIVNSIYENSNIDLRKFFSVRQTDVNKEERIMLLSSIAYQTDIDLDNIYDDTHLLQRYMRFIWDLEYNYPITHQYGPTIRFWEHYLKEPNTDVVTSQGAQFSQVPIRVQDIYFQNLVDKYAADDYQSLPLQQSHTEGMNNLGVRKTADNQKEFSLANYLWDKSKFATNHLSMWNDRILFLRVKKVYDRGWEYGIMDDDNSRLHRTSSVKFSDEFFQNGEAENVIEHFDHYFESILPSFQHNIWLDGKEFMFDNEQW